MHMEYCACVYSVCEGGGDCTRLLDLHLMSAKNVQILVSCEISPHSLD